ncbi:MAG: stage III sporulation AC/AD family protein [Oscillospiraceae bacterium]
MELAVKVAAAGLISVVCVVLIKKHSPELALLLGTAAAAAICFAALPQVRAVWELWDSFARSAGLSSAVMTPVAKCVALGLITRLCSDLCKDSGSSSIATAVEIVGCVSALLAASPLMTMLLEMMGGLI